MKNSLSFDIGIPAPIGMGSQESAALSQSVQPLVGLLSPLVVVAAALVDGRGRILMQQRPKSRQHGGLWEFPGGKVEPGEGPLAALARELAEELAITIASEACLSLGFAASESEGGRSVVLLLYGLRQWHGNAISQEGAELAWVAGDALAGLAMPPLDVPLAQLAARFAAAA